MYEKARELFKYPQVENINFDLKLGKPNEKGLLAFMRGKPGFNETSIRSGFKKLANVSIEETNRGAFNQVRIRLPLT